MVAKKHVTFDNCVYQIKFGMGNIFDTLRIGEQHTYAYHSYPTLEEPTGDITLPEVKARLSSEECARLSCEAREGHPDKVPVIVQPHGFILQNCKFLVSKHLTFISLLRELRQVLLSEEHVPSMFIVLYVRKNKEKPVRLPIATKLGDAYSHHMSDDELLYVHALIE